MKYKLSYNEIGDYLLSTIPEFEGEYRKHLALYDGKILQHVLFGDFTRFVIDVFRKSKNNPEYKKLFVRCLDFIEDLMNTDDEQLTELASVSFLENLHQADDDYEGIKIHLSKKSMDQLKQIEGAS